MKINAKRLLSLFLTLVLLCGVLAVPAAAATEQAKAAADELYQLGLLHGSGTLPDGSPNFNLEGTVSRAEAVTMLVQLLGKADEAASKHYAHPFTDVPGWATDYVGYAYHTDYVSGISKTEFGADRLITAGEFVTLVLHALNYQQVNWQNPYPAAQSAGLSWSGGNDFRRGDLIYTSNSALSCVPNGSTGTLLESLKAQGAIKPPVEKPEPPAAGITPGPVAPTAASSYTVTSKQDALDKLVAAVNGRVQTITLKGPYSLIEDCNSAAESMMVLCSDVKGYSSSWTYDYSSMTMTITPKYTDAVEIMAYLEGKRSSISQANAQTLAKAQQVQGSLIKPGMSEYDRVKVLHDWLVNNTSYGGSSDRRYTAGGALVDGVAVCDGYAMAFDLLCYLSGIDCIRVTGWANGDHAWNKVKVNGSWYNIDVTWDDPITNYGPVLLYDYFLISDAAIAKDHVQNTSPYWPAAPASWSGK